MSVVSLSWHGVPYAKDRFFVKGAVIAQALVPGTLSRFAVREVRSGRDDEGYPTLRYALADAETVSDAEVREGKLPKAVFWADTPDECVSAAISWGQK